MEILQFRIPFAPGNHRSRDRRLGYAMGLHIESYNEL
jgi:hypothetical protein